MKRALCAILAALFLAAGLSGCGYPELYERILIHGIGVDWEDGEYLVTVRSSTSAEEGEELFTCQGPTVLEALSSLSLSTGREPFYSHNYLVVFGMGCARRGLDDCLDFFVRYYNTRPTVKLFLSAGTAQEVLSIEKDSQLMRMSELQALGGSGRYNGQAVDMDILRFINDSKREGGAPVLPLLQAEEDGVEVVGTAYFERSQVKGVLDSEQTRGYLAAVGWLERGELAVSLEDAGTATLSLRSAESKITSRAEGTPSFQVEIQVEADLSAADFAPGPDASRTQLESAAARQLTDNAVSAIQQAVERDRCDIFGFGDLLYRRSPGVWRDMAADWQNQMAQSQFSVEVSVTLRRLEEENGGSLLS